MRTALVSALSLLSLATTTFAYAQTEPSSAQPDRAAFHAAFEACISENNLQKPQPGQPPSDADREVLDQCLKSKGFTHLRGHHRGAPPAQNAESSVAQ